MGYQRSKSSNAIETAKKNVTFINNKNNLSDEDYCQDECQIEKQKGKVKKKQILHKTISFEPPKSNVSQKCNVVYVGSPLKKKSFSLMSLVARKNPDVTITPTEGDTKATIHGRNLGKKRNNEIEEKRTAGMISQYNNEAPKTLLTKVVSPSEQCVNPTSTTKKNVNGENNHISFCVPSLSSKVLSYFRILLRDLTPNS